MSERPFTSHPCGPLPSAPARAEPGPYGAYGTTGIRAAGSPATGIGSAAGSPATGICSAADSVATLVFAVGDSSLLVPDLTAGFSPLAAWT